MVTYTAIYRHPKTGTTIRIHSLNPPPSYRTFRMAGGKRRFKLVKHKATTRKVLIVAKSAKNKKKGKDTIVDDELDELEELEDLDDLEDEDLEDEDDEEPDDEDDEDEDEDEEDDDEEDEDDLDSMNVKELRARARELGIAVKGLKKDELADAIRNHDPDEEDEEEDDDEDEEEEEEPAPKKKSKKSSKGKAKGKKSSRSRTTDGKVGTQEIAEAAGIDARKLRILLRKMRSNGEDIEPDPETGRYEYSSLNHPMVKKILKAVKSGAADAAAREGLSKLKDRKGKKGKSKKTGAARTKSSGKKHSKHGKKKGKK